MNLITIRNDGQDFWSPQKHLPKVSVCVFKDIMVLGYIYYGH